MLAYRRIFIRLADKAVGDYNDARQHVLLLIGRQKSGALDIADGRLLMNLITNRLETVSSLLGASLAFLSG
jgi:hypothetical protein